MQTAAPATRRRTLWLLLLLFALGATRGRAGAATEAGARPVFDAARRADRGHRRARAAANPRGGPRRTWTTTRNTSTGRGFRTPAYRQAFRDFLRLKYKDVRFDVVIAVAGRRARTRRPIVREPVVSRHADRLLRVGSRDRPHRKRDRPRRGLNFTDTLALIADLQPEVRQRLCRHRRGAGRPGVRTPGAAAIPAVRDPVRDSLPHWPASCRTRVPPFEPAGRLRDLLLARQPGRQRPERSSARVSVASGRDRQRAGLLLGRLGDGSRHRRREPEGSDAYSSTPSAGSPSACCPANRRPASRSHHRI